MDPSHGRGAVVLVFAACVLALFAGCASVTNPANERRVTEYGGGVDGGMPMTVGGSGVIGGCRLVQAGETDGCLRYVGTKCSYTSPQCGQDEPSAPAGDEPAPAPQPPPPALTGPQRFPAGQVPPGWISIPGTDGWWAPPGTVSGLGLEPDL